MYSKTLVASALLAVVAAQFSNDASSVQSGADNLASAVSSWSSGDGLQGALGIQNSFGPFVSLVDSLSADAGSLSSDDITPDLVNSLVSSVVGLLDALTSKASDFESVGAQSIVSGDISSVQGPAVDIASSIAAAAQSGSDAASYIDALSSYSSAFDAADSAYSLSTSEFPSISAGSASSAAATSSASSSAESSASESSAASTAASSSESSAASSSSEATSVPLANSGVSITAGVGAAFAGIAALLM